MENYEKILKQAEKEMLELNHPYVGTEHLTLAILKNKSKLTEFLKTKKLTYKKFKNKLLSIVGISQSKSEYILYTPMLRSIINEAKEISEEESIPLDEVLLFNCIINEGEGIAVRIMAAMDIDFTQLKFQEQIKIKDGIVLNNVITEEKVIGRTKEINELMQVLLRKNKCNPLLIGKAGVGKSAIVEQLARLINKGAVPQGLKDAKIIKIDFGNLIAGTKYRGEFEEKITNLLNEIKKYDNLILFVDEAHTIVNAGGADGAISAGDIFKPFLARGDIKLIGATTINEYHKFMESDKALNRRFQTILVEEPNLEETKNILLNVKEDYEKFHGVKISNELVELIINLTNKYIKNKSNPDKSIEILDTLLSKLKFEEKIEATKDDVYNLINERFHINLLNNNCKICEILDKNQCLIVDNLTEFNNQIKKIYKNNSYININLDDYKTEYSLYKLIGYPNNPDKEYLFRDLIDNPFGIINITNIDESNPLFNKIFKERKIVDNFGNDIDFHTCLIITNKKNETTSIGFIKSNRTNTLLKDFVKWEEDKLYN